MKDQNKTKKQLIAELKEAEIEPWPAGELEDAVAAFRYRDAVYGVPDLPAWQAAVAAKGAAA
jgi:hypothetical protein